MYRIIVVFLVCTSLFACEYTPIVPDDSPEVGDVSFANDVEPIFTDASCINCHNGGAQKPDLRKTYAYESLMSNPDFTDYNYKTNIYDYPKPSGEHQTKFKSLEQAAIIQAWIDQGKQDN